MDELRLSRALLRVERTKALLCAQGPSALPNAYWNETDRRLRPFPNLRFQFKVLKIRWHLAQGNDAVARNAAEKLVQRPECNDARRDEIHELVGTVTLG